jgi:hypothetical protein
MITMITEHDHDYDYSVLKIDDYEYDYSNLGKKCNRLQSITIVIGPNPECNACLTGHPRVSFRKKLHWQIRAMSGLPSVGGFRVS